VSIALAPGLNFIAILLSACADRLRRRGASPVIARLPTGRPWPAWRRTAKLPSISDRNWPIAALTSVSSDAAWLGRLLRSAEM